jgi:sterol desaturase/sphingolipid hydroxylase (fatty acid hydroxylase superfamily)
VTTEALIRIVAFATVFAAMLIWELAGPRRPLTVARRIRWPANLGVLAIDTLLVRLLFPAAAVGFAFMVQDNGWGLLGRMALAPWIAIALTFIVLDLAIYGQHVLFHAAPPLWRLHRMHHADLDFDVTTGVRFHPGEILLSMFIKLAVIAALGAHPLGVLIFELLLNATSMFNHGNVRVPSRLDGRLRWIVVTPEMHRVHHSIERRETDSNFGFNLPWWDRLFGTYRAQPEEGHERMLIGIREFRRTEDLRLDRMLLQPFRSGRHAAQPSRPTGSDV